LHFARRDGALVVLRSRDRRRAGADPVDGRFARPYGLMFDRRESCLQPPRPGDLAKASSRHAVNFAIRRMPAIAIRTSVGRTGSFLAGRAYHRKALPKRCRTAPTLGIERVVIVHASVTGPTIRPRCTDEGAGANARGIAVIDEKRRRAISTHGPGRCARHPPESGDRRPGGPGVGRQRFQQAAARLKGGLAHSGVRRPDGGIAHQGPVLDSPCRGIRYFGGAGPHWASISPASPIFSN